MRLVRCLLPLRRNWGPWTGRRVSTLVLFVPAFLGLQLLHWIGFLADDVFFRGYRKVQVAGPLFVLGLPRSGTSYLQRALAEDEGTTTMRLWELVLAPSVLERRIWLGLAAIDRAVGSPIGRVLSWGGTRLFRWMDEVHPVGLDEPEEDFLLLSAAFSCFLLVLPFPMHPEVWRLTQFDDWDPSERAAIMRFYHSCLQRHLYVVGPEKRLLSKNPSFTAFARSLAEAFPDAKFLYCVRDPREAVPSQLSAVAGGMRLFGVDVSLPSVRERIVDMMERFANHAMSVSEAVGSDRWAFVPLTELHGDLTGTVERAYARFGWSLDPTFRAALVTSAAEARAYRSAHNYPLEPPGLERTEIEHRFRAFMEVFSFDDPRAEPVGPPQP